MESRLRIRDGARRKGADQDRADRGWRRPHRRADTDRDALSREVVDRGEDAHLNLEVSGAEGGLPRVSLYRGFLTC